MMLSPMKIAVVILNWNGKKLLEKFLPQVVEHSAQAPIFVVDNASQDDSVPYVREHFPSVQIIENKENLGFAGGYNEGLKHINADVFCLLNSDVWVTPHWLCAPLEIFANQPEIAAIQPKILSLENPEKFEYAGAAGGFLDRYGFPFCRGRIFDTTEYDSGQYDQPTEIFWASGACLFIRSEIFRQLGGFDPDFFAHQEEIDLCWRIHQLGKKIIFTPQSVVYHLGGATLSAASGEKVFLNFRNGLFLLLKNLPKNQLFSTIFCRMVLDGIAAIRFALQGKFSFFWAILRAHFQFYKKLQYFYKKRQNITIKDYFFRKSVVYLYYIKKKKYFSEF